MAFLVLLLFYMTNGYMFGWDDQHLEVPLLKSLIDESLYVGDYYVASLKKNFTSFFYPILAKIISVDQIEPAYFLLFLLSRYFMFFWMYQLWVSLSRDRLTAFLCLATFILMGRTDEFLYRTFSHQEFALAMIFAGIYLFYRDRFLLASALLGLSVNIHALYSLFPMIYVLVYLGITHRHHGSRWNT